MGWQVPIAIAQSSAKEVIAGIKMARTEFKNATITSEWEEEWDGVPKSWESQKWTWDHFGRRRLTYRHGRVGDQREHLPPNESLEIDTLFDGEVLLNQQYYPDRDRQGGNDPDLTKGYRASIVSDAAAPARRELESHRNPLEYLWNTAMRELGHCEANEVPIAVREIDGLTELEFVPPSTGDDSPVRSIVRVDMNRGPSLVSWSTFDAAGKMTSEIATKLGESNGRWIATEGSHRNWGERATSSPPIFDWHFRVTEFVVNDPNFDDQIFRINLAPDTAVSDTRFKVAYRVGAKQATVNELAKLAEIAQRDDRADAPRSRFSVLIAINLLFFAALIWFVVQRNRSAIGKAAIILVTFATVASTQATEPESARALPENPYSMDDAKCCGPHCLLFLDGYFLRQQRIDKILRECPPGAMGTNLEQIETAARSLGFHTAPVKQLDLPQLRRLRFPAVIHMKGDNDAGHFMVTLGFDDRSNCFRGFSPPKNYGLFDAESVAKSMTGFALVVSNDPLPPVAELVQSESVIVSWLGSSWLAIALAGLMMLQWKSRLAQFVSKWVQRFCQAKRAGVQVSTLGLFLLPQIVGCGEQNPASFDPSIPTLHRASDVNPLEVDLGKIQDGTPVKHDFRLINHSDVAIRIVAIEKSCSCQVVSVDQKSEIAPGQSRSISMGFDTKGLDGPVSQSIRVRTDSSDPKLKEVAMTLRAVVDAGIKVIPTQIMFGQVKPGEPMKRRVQLRVTHDRFLDQPVRVVAGDSPYLQVRKVETALGLSTYEVEVDPRIPPGPIYGQLSFQFDHPDIKDIQVSIVGTRLGNLNIIPRMLSVQESLSFPQSRLLRVSSNDHSPFRIQEVRVPEGASVRSIHPTDASSSFELDVEVSSRLDLHSHPFVTIQSDSTEMNEISIPIVVES